MATQKDIYAPRPLSTSIEYPGYQFYATREMDAEEREYTMEIAPC